MDGPGQPVIVASADDPRLTDYLALTDVRLRSRREPADGLFIAEGETVVRRALAAGYRPRSLLLDERRADERRDLVASVQRAGGSVLLAPAPVLEQVTGFAVHRGILASMHRRPLPAAVDVLARARRLVVLEDLVDHTNVGAVFRAVAGLGWDGMLLSPRCADPLYRRSVRVSMGAVLALPYARLPDWRGGLHPVRTAGFTLVALTPDAAAGDLRELASDPPERLALVLGTEGEGLSRRWLSEADRRVRIAMSHGVDSLNVAAAAAVACYALGPSRAPWT